MIIRRTERDYKDSIKTWINHGSWDKEVHVVSKNRVTWWFLFIPLFSYIKIIKTQL